MNDEIAAQLQEIEFMRKRLTVTMEDYSSAVESLLKLAQGDTSGSRAAAQVLLSTYNGSNYQMDLTDLCVLDLEYFERALIVLRGRVLLFEEPHNVISDGSQRFLDLEGQWSSLHVTQRYNRFYEG